MTRKERWDCLARERAAIQQEQPKKKGMVFGARASVEEFADFDWGLVIREIAAIRNALTLAERAADPRYLERHLESAQRDTGKLREYCAAYRFRRRLIA